MLADRVATWIRDEGLSQTRAAARLRVPPAWLRRFLRGEIHQPRDVTLQRLSDAMGIPVKELAVACLVDQAVRLRDSIRGAVAHPADSDDIGDTTREAVRAMSSLDEQLRAVVAEGSGDDLDVRWQALAARLSRRQKQALLLLIG